MDFVAVMDHAIALLHELGRQDGVHWAGNVRSAHGCCISGGTSRVTPDADAAREDSQEGTWDRDGDKVARGVDAGAGWIVA